jgi:hypothetical protein
MSLYQILEFNPLDNPMQLSKIGNWLITYVSPKEELDNIQLAITYVLPRQISDQLQPRRVIIHKLESAYKWHVEQIECYDSSTQQEILIQDDETTWNMILEQICREFHKYDVDVSLKSVDEI